MTERCAIRMKPFNTATEQERQGRDTRKLISGHTCSERISRSFDFRKGREWAYTFSLTWTPDHLTLTGDVGEMTLSNHSLRDLIGALEWAQHGDIDYLLSKSNMAYREFSPEATFQQIVHMANERAFYSLTGLRSERRAWRTSQPDAFTWKDSFGHGYSWTEQRSDWEVWQEERPKLEVERDFPRSHTGTGRRLLDMPQVDVPPDGWELWESLREELCPWLETADILTSKGRREIKRRLEGSMQDGRHSVVDLIQRCRIDDYYGSEVISGQAILRIECIRHGAWLALLHLEPQRMYDWRPTSIYDREMRDAFPVTTRRLEADHKAEIQRRRAERMAA